MPSSPSPAGRWGNTGSESLMETLETLGRRIATTEDLGSIVRTMKSLSAVSIRQYERAVEALRDYSRTIEAGMQVVLGHDTLPVPETGRSKGRTIVIVFGSDHGLCGRFNREIVRHARHHSRECGSGEDHILHLVAGARAAAQLEAAGERIQRSFPLPGSVAGLTGTAENILLEIDALRSRQAVARVLVFNNMRSEDSTATPDGAQLLPLDPQWLRRLAGRRWPSRALPAFTMEPQALFAALVRQHLFIGLFRAGAESAASEHATRLAAMQAAERNIEDHLTEMSTAFRRVRQAAITEELLDVVAGFEALEDADEDHV